MCAPFIICPLCTTRRVAVSMLLLAEFCLEPPPPRFELLRFAWRFSDFPPAATASGTWWNSLELIQRFSARGGRWSGAAGMTTLPCYYGSRHGNNHHLKSVDKTVTKDSPWKMARVRVCDLWRLSTSVGCLRPCESHWSCWRSFFSPLCLLSGTCSMFFFTLLLCEWKVKHDKALCRLYVVGIIRRLSLAASGIINAPGRYSGRCNIRH